MGPPPCLGEVALHGANFHVVDADVNPAFGENFSCKISAAGRWLGFYFFSPAKNRAVVRIPQRDSAERAFNKLARTFAAQSRGAQALPGGGEQTMQRVRHISPDFEPLRALSEATANFDRPRIGASSQVSNYYVGLARRGKRLS
jgi:hypothetical protein